MARLHAFYGTATGASWIVPRKYLEKVGDDGFKRAPIGAGPYRFISFTAGVELVAEAFDRYWRKAPNVKRLLIRSVPDESTRLAALKSGEVDGYTGSAASWPTSCNAPPDWPSKRRTPRRNASISPSSGIRNRRGTTCGCGRHSAWQSITTPSTRPSPWAIPS